MQAAPEEVQSAVTPFDRIELPVKQRRESSPIGSWDRIMGWAPRQLGPRRYMTKSPKGSWQTQYVKRTSKMDLYKSTGRLLQKDKEKEQKVDEVRSERNLKGVPSQKNYEGSCRGDNEELIQASPQSSES